MPHIISRPSWYLPEGAATPEDLYVNRRSFLQSMGAGGLMLAGVGACAAETPGPGKPKPPYRLFCEAHPLPPFEKNPAYAGVGRPLTERVEVLTFNNFYEFGFSKTDPRKNAKNFTLEPYTLEVNGLVENKLKLSLEDIEKLGLEERVYRFRCVEAWAMTVPWLGVPLRKILEKAGVKAEAKFVAMRCFFDPDRAPGQRHAQYGWPYHEGLRIDEAMNDLTLLATGLYGERLRPQSGTPLRVVVPWKYGYKGPKSVVMITVMNQEPATFWNEANNVEYKFYSNVDPQVPHPRWSQAEERYLGEDYKDHPTQWYNGYGEQVAHMYTDMPRVLY